MIGVELDLLMIKLKIKFYKKIEFVKDYKYN